MAARCNRPLIFSVINSLVLLAFGIAKSQKGTAFKDLIRIANTDVKGGSFFITVSNLGAMFGCLLSGAIYGRVQRKPLLGALPAIAFGVLIALIPWCSVYAAMVAVHGLAFFFSAVFDTALNTEEIQAWDGNSQSAVQFVSFCYSVGGVLGPFITEPFLASKEDRTDNSSSSPDISSSINATRFILDWNISTPTAATAQPMISADLCSPPDTNCTDSFAYNLAENVRFSYNGSSPDGNFTSVNEQSRLHYAYLITGVFSIAIGIMALCAIFIWQYPIKERRKKHDNEVSQTSRKLPMKIHMALIGLVCAYVCVHSTVINCFVEYLFYFLVTHLDWGKEKGAYLYSMYWGLAVVTKLALAIIYRSFKTGPGVVLVFSVVAIVASLTAFTIAAYLHSDTFVWISSACMSVSQASIFSGCFAWADGHLFKMTGKETSALMISASLGSLWSPIPVGILMKNWTLMAFPYFVLLQSCISGGLFLVIMFVVKPFVNRRYGPLRPPILNAISKEDEGQEMIAENEIDNDVFSSQIFRVEAT